MTPTLALQRPQGAPRPAAGPDPERLARLIVTAFLEVEVGRRPLDQLSRLLSPALRARLETTARRPGPGPTRDAVLAVRSCRPHPDACDAAVVVRRGGRVGVVVVRLERHHAIWRAVELARPEDATAAPPWAPPARCPGPRTSGATRLPAVVPGP